MEPLVNIQNDTSSINNEIVPNLDITSIADSIPSNPLDPYRTSSSPIASDLQSPNYKKDTTGWKLGSNGVSEFNQITILGVPKYYGTATTDDASTTIGFASLPLHDEWILKFNIKNIVNTARIDPMVIINNISTNTYYSGFYTDVASGYVNYNTGVYSGWIVTRMVSDNFINLIGEMHITGKHNNGEKGCWSQFSRSGALSNQIGVSGIMTGDSADVSRIEITFGANATGQVEFYYKDNV